MNSAQRAAVFKYGSDLPLLAIIGKQAFKVLPVEEPLDVSFMKLHLLCAFLY